MGTLGNDGTWHFRDKIILYLSFAIVKRTRLIVVEPQTKLIIALLYEFCSIDLEVLPIVTDLFLDALYYFAIQAGHVGIGELKNEGNSSQ